MNNRLKKKKIAWIHQANKARKNQSILSNQELEGMEGEIQKQVIIYETFVNEYAGQVRRTKIELFICMLPCAILSGLIFFKVDVGIGMNWMLGLFFISALVISALLTKFFFYQSQLSFWKEQRSDDNKFLERIKECLRRKS